MDSLEQRVEALESNVRDALSESMVTDMVLRALIVTHPEKAVATRVLEATWRDHQLRVRDAGFARGMAAHVAKDMLDRMEVGVQRWLALLLP